MLKQSILAVAILTAWGLSAAGNLTLTEITQDRLCHVYGAAAAPVC